MRAAVPSLELNVAAGARICVPAALDQITPYVLLEQEDWFEHEIRFVRGWLRPGMRALDVGASFGIYTLAIARAAGAEGRVWSFEPTEEVAGYLARSIARNELRNVELHRQAVSDREGTLEFCLGEESERNAVKGGEPARGEVRQVRATSLDRFAAAHAPGKIDFLKLDVEGHEFEAIKGAAALLGEGSPLVMFEIKAEMAIDLRPLEPLAELGYEFYRLLPGPLWLAPFDSEGLASMGLLNVFACKPELADSLAAEGKLVRAEEVELGSPGAAAWRSFVERSAYAAGFSSRWPAKAGFFAGGGLAAYLEGLAAYASSREQARPLEERHAWLNHALRSVTEALDAKPTLARKISFARIAADLGFRVPAYEALAEAVGWLEGDSALAEPFLAPIARYEALPSADPAEWMKCAVIEAVEKSRAFSSRFVGSSSLDVLASVRGLPLCAPELERRFQLVRMLHGMQAAPEPAEALRARSAENLNPELWARAAPFSAGMP